MADLVPFLDSISARSLIPYLFIQIQSTLLSRLKNAIVHIINY